MNIVKTVVIVSALVGWTGGAWAAQRTVRQAATTDTRGDVRQERNEGRADRKHRDGREAGRRDELRRDEREAQRDRRDAIRDRRDGRRDRRDHRRGR